MAIDPKPTQREIATAEAVNHPAHYGGADNPYEAIKVIEAWGLGFCLGNTVKYISRAGKKDDVLQDLKKARWYLDREITNRQQPTPERTEMIDTARAFQQAFHDTPVREFHEVFGHPVSYDPKAAPDIGVRVLRVQMLASELVELARAMGVKLKIDTTQAGDEDAAVLCADDGSGRYDPVESADALGDLRYIVDGGNLVCGFPGELVLAEIHRSNMSKLGADGKPVKREDGKILKGPNYFKPNIAKVIGLERQP